MRAFRTICLLTVLLLPQVSRACDVALLLAVDVSGSVDPDEYRVQMDGLAAAIRDPLVSEALVRGQSAVSLMQWSGVSRQVVTIPWTLIRDYDDVERLAQLIETDPRRWRNYSTAIGEALQQGVLAMRHAPVCDRKVIDVSGDGVSNEGGEPTYVHPSLQAADITVNGLVIDVENVDLFGYYERNVITGPKSFVMSANSFEEYPSRIREKLLRELAALFAGRP